MVATLPAAWIGHGLEKLVEFLISTHGVPVCNRQIMLWLAEEDRASDYPSTFSPSFGSCDRLGPSGGTS
jgi:hypothetical protein